MTTTKRTMADLAAAFNAKNQDENTNATATWKLFFPFWKAEVGSVSRIRFLPDLDENNSLGFLVENVVHELTINGKRETVACGEMYGDDCPICKASRDYYAQAKEAGETKERPGPLMAMGKKFYRKKSYIGQCLVVDTPIEHDQNQLVKLIDFGPKIFNQINTAFKSGDLDEKPYEFEGGYDFRINKTKSGDYADYGTSSFAPKQTNVSMDLIEQIELYDLAKYRAARVEPEVAEALLASALTGGSAKPKPAAAKPAPVADDADDSAEQAEAAAPTGEKKMSIADQLRARQAARQAANTED